MIQTKTAEELWAWALTQLKPELKEDTFDLWLKPLQATQLENGVLTVRVPNRFFSDWIKNHYQARVESLLSMEAEKPIVVQYEMAVEETSHEKPSYASSNNFRTAIELKPSPEKPDTTVLTGDELKEATKYAFDTFVVGPSNRFAEAAAEAVAKSPGRTYNPLFIYGGVGLGKTHLLHSIGHWISTTRANARVLYVSSEQFINEFINAIRFEKMKDFRNKYRSLDCLLIDDIQFLMGKDSSQEEFFYTFNTLYDSRKQIVICSDRTPKETSLSDRLISRFEWGVIADIQPPDFGNPHRHFEKKTTEAGFQPPEDVILFVASHIKTNIRELEGSMTRILAYSSLTGEQLTVDTARRVLKDILGAPEHASPVTIDQVQRVVARHFNLDLRDMKSKRRTDAIAFPRQIAMYLARTLTELSTLEIGAGFGGKDHTTVMHACTKIKNKLSGDPYFVALINKITQEIREESLLNLP